jgi:DNA-binding FadR family transcriptional regulator
MDRRWLEGPVARQSLAATVTEAIGRAIVSGKLAPNSGLPNELALTAELGVSRAVLREGLKLLASKGLIQAKPRSGTVVSPRRLWNLLDVDILTWHLSLDPTERLINAWFDFRLQFEPIASRLAASASSEALADIREAFEEMAETEVTSSGSIEADVRFHRLILEASGNEFFVPLARTVEGALRASFLLSVDRRGARENALPLHEDVVNAIFRRKGAAAERAMLRLLDASRHDLLWIAFRKERKQPETRARSARRPPRNGDKRTSR